MKRSHAHANRTSGRPSERLCTATMKNVHTRQGLGNNRRRRVRGSAYRYGLARAQKSNCTLILANLGVSTEVGANQAPGPLVTLGL